VVQYRPTINTIAPFQNINCNPRVKTTYFTARGVVNWSTSTVLDLVVVFALYKQVQSLSYDYKRHHEETKDN